MKRKSPQICITLEPEIIRMLEDLQEYHGKSRSEVIADLVRQEHGNWYMGAQRVNELIDLLTRD